MNFKRVNISWIITGTKKRRRFVATPPYRINFHEKPGSCGEMSGIKQLLHEKRCFRGVANYFILKSITLPDDDSFLLRKEHRSVGYAEGLVEGLDVAEGCVHTVLAEGVDIGLGEAGCLLVTDVLAPDCRV